MDWIIARLSLADCQNYFVEARFYVWLLPAIVAYRFLAPRLNVAARQVLLTVISVVFLSRLAGAELFLPLMFGYAACVAILGKWMQQLAGQGNPRPVAMAGCIGLLVAFLICYQYPNYLRALGGDSEWINTFEQIRWIGLSYLTFRAIDLLILARSGRIETYQFSAAIAYLLFFVPIVAGPINRFGEWLDDAGRSDERMSFQRFRNNLLRISVGIVKILFLARWAYYNSIISPNYAGMVNHTWWSLTISMYAYFLYIYLDFSGYCDCAIAIAEFFGVKLPENFNYPFISHSIQDFWNRWHISLSHWCRDHIFFRSMMFLAARWPRVPRLVSSCACVFLTFVIIGSWHGDRLHWFVYGCYHGAGLVGHTLYKNLLTARWPDFAERLAGSNAYRAICIFATFNFVAGGLLLTVGFSRAAAILNSVQ